VLSTQDVVGRSAPLAKHHAPRCCAHRAPLHCRHDATLARWTRTPSLLWLHGSLGLTAEAMFALLCCVGFVLAAAAACGVHHCLVFTGLWAAYLSFVNVGGAFLEAG
jgi:hypothetical protein